MSALNRRDFLTLTAAGITTAKTVGPQTGKSIRLVFVGIGGRGSYHLDCALGMVGVEVVAVCDIDDKALYRAKRWVEEAGQPTPRLYGDSKTAYSTQSPHLAAVRVH